MTSYPFYSQVDPRWEKRILGRNINIQHAGCALTCCAMWLSGELKDPSITPLTLDDWMDKNKGYVGDMLVWDKVIEFANSKGSKVKTVKMDQEIMHFPLHDSMWLDPNRVPLVRGHYRDNSSKYHYELLIDKTGIVNNPGNLHGQHAHFDSHVIVPDRLIWFLE